MEEASGQVQDFEVLLSDLQSRISVLSSKTSLLSEEKNSYMDLKINLFINYYTNYT